MILITGGTGLVGSHLLYHLCLVNKEVRAIHRRSSDLNSAKKVFSYYGGEHETLFRKIRWVEADLLDLVALEKAFEGVEQVYHCAAMVSFVSSDYQKMRKVNIEGTTNVANLSIQFEIKKICYVSSVAAIDNTAQQNMIDEADNWSSTEDKSGYAITKYGAEMEIWRASQEGVPVVIVNPGVILGPGFWHTGSGTMFSRIDKGMPFYSNGLTGFVDVKDVVSIMISLMESTIVGERFILVSENLTYREVLFQIAAALKKPKPRIRINKWMAEFIWRFEFLKSKITLSPPLLTKHTARSSVSTRAYSSQKVIETLDWKFTKIEDCIDRVVHNYEKDTSDK
jgi:nucleoside-diphosphate-sugar epimerase